MTKIAQFRYYGIGNDKNYPNDLFSNDQSMTMLKKYSPLKRIIIQTIPGIRIYFNGVNNYSYIIEQTGILDLNNTQLQIDGLIIDQKSLDILNTINNSYFIITIIYETKLEVMENGN